MKKLAFACILALVCTVVRGQDPSLIFARFIKDSPDTVWCNLNVWKKVDSEEYIVKTKRFHDQTMLSLDKGEYVFEYIVCDSGIFVDRLVLNGAAETVIMNILLEPTPLEKFDFSKVISADPILYEFINRRFVYMEF